MPKKERLNFIDVARTLAIILALFSHAMIDFEGWKLLGSIAAPIRLLTRSATPLFIFMFGMMLELVYLKKLEQQGLSPVAKRLAVRSLQCYIGLCFNGDGWLYRRLILIQGSDSSPVYFWLTLILAMSFDSTVLPCCWPFRCLHSADISNLRV